MIVRPKWDYCMKELFRNFIILKYFISDILDIPIEKIRSLKLRNTNLWRRYKYQKQGIVDVLKMYHHQHFGGITYFGIEQSADRATSRRVDSTVQCRDRGGSGNIGNNDEESWNFGSGERGKAYESWKMGESQIR